jgi:hypothetical protein
VTTEQDQTIALLNHAIGLLHRANDRIDQLADTTWFTFSLLPLWSEEQGTVNCPCVTVILAWSALMTSYKPHRLVRVVFD